MRASLMALGVNAAGGNYNYKTNGADWPNIDPACGATNQSPINLRTDWDTIDAEEDGFNKVYTN